MSKINEASEKNKQLKDELWKRGMYVNPISRDNGKTIEYLIVSYAEPLPIHHTSMDTCQP